MDGDDLVMESTTDSPAEIREGLGLPAVVEPAPVVAATEAVVVPAVAAAVIVPLVEASTSRPKRKRASDATRAAQDLTTAQATTDAAIATRQRELDDKIVASAAAVAAEAAKAKPAVVAPIVAEPVAAPIVAALAPADLSPAVVDPIKAQFQAKRTALGAEPKQDDFENFDAFRHAERAYDRKLAVIDTQEDLALQGAAASATQVAQQATQRVHTALTTFEQDRVATKAVHADWDAVMAQATVPLLPHIQQALIEAGPGLSGELIYRLAKDPARLQKIQSQSTLIQSLTELAALGAEIRGEQAGSRLVTSAATAPAGATAAGTPVQVALPSTRPVTRAPEPPSTVLGGSPGTASHALENAADQAEYNRLRDKQVRARRGR